eukprot:COSAG06_NODE_5270_length_3595_cov_3313.468535_1_plen_531_part_00
MDNQAETRTPLTWLCLFTVQVRAVLRPECHPQDYYKYSFDMAKKSDDGPKGKGKGAATKAAATGAAGAAPSASAAATTSPPAAQQPAPVMQPPPAAQGAASLPPPAGQPPTDRDIQPLLNSFGQELMTVFNQALTEKLAVVAGLETKLSERIDTAIAGVESKMGAAGAAGVAAAATTPKKVHIFTLTGGPGAGKTSIIALLHDWLRARGTAVVVKKEGATADFTSIGGFRSEWADDPAKMAALQANMLRNEISALDAAKRFAAMMTTGPAGQDVVLLMDRCGLDGKAFCGEEAWSHALSECGTTEADLITSAGTILHLVSTAVDKPDAYDYGAGSSNPARHSDAAAAIAADVKLREIFSAANNGAGVQVFGNINKSFAAKADDVYDLVCNAVGLPCKRMGPASAQTAAGKRTHADMAAGGGAPAGPANPDTLQAAAGLATPTLLDMQKQLKGIPTGDHKAVAKLFADSGFKLDFGAATHGCQLSQSMFKGINTCAQCATLINEARGVLGLPDALPLARHAPSVSARNGIS